MKLPLPSYHSLQATETILVVEDLETVRKLVRESLETQGYHVLEASSAESALPLFRQYEGTIHLMLTDVVMPGMSGRDLAHRVMDSRKELRVLYMSGYTDDTKAIHA